MGYHDRRYRRRFSGGHFSKAHSPFLMKTEPRIKAEILAVGSELLSPSFIDTNTPLMIGKLNGIGIDVAFRTIVGDDWTDLVGCFKTAWKRSRIILVSGGLGPTDDDRTRDAAAEVLKRKLVFLPEIEKVIRKRFRRRGIAMPASNRKQCYSFEGAVVLANPNGTAPGLWICAEGRKLALLPGPPHELEPMFDKGHPAEAPKKRDGIASPDSQNHGDFRISHGRQTPLSLS